LTFLVKKKPIWLTLKKDDAIGKGCGKTPETGFLVMRRRLPDPPVLAVVPELTRWPGCSWGRVECVEGDGKVSWMPRRGL